MVAFVTDAFCSGCLWHFRQWGRQYFQCLVWVHLDGRRELTELLTKERHERNLCFPYDDWVSSLKGFFSFQRNIMFFANLHILFFLFLKEVRLWSVRSVRTWQQWCVFFLSSCANSYIGDNATHLWQYAYNVKICVAVAKCEWAFSSHSVVSFFILDNVLVLY